MAEEEYYPDENPDDTPGLQLGYSRSLDDWSGEKPPSDSPSKIHTANPILSEISHRLLGASNGGARRVKDKVKEYGEGYDDDKHYGLYKLKKPDVEKATKTQEPIAKPNALKLKHHQKKFDKNANKIRERLSKVHNKIPDKTYEMRAQKALNVVDKLENKERQEAAKMKREIRTIKQQETMAKFGPYGKLVALFLGCKNWCLGHAVIICTVTGGLGYIVLKLTGAI